MKKGYKRGNMTNLDELIQELEDKYDSHKDATDLAIHLDAIASLFKKNHENEVPGLKKAESLVDVFEIFVGKNVISSEELTSLEELIFFGEKIDYDLEPELDEVNFVRDKVYHALNKMLIKLK